MDSKKAGSDATAPIKTLSLKKETLQRLNVRADIRTGIKNLCGKITDPGTGGGGNGGGSGGPTK